ncbi:PEF-CTERM sorting domain-containing protein [Methanolobus sp. ZRKC2]|uniref:PEF-CTERM sorting domain-containing protein n=1 Tax=Methanolobus sp. ZRKC2 TaxID=3125783 RepID=UPI00324D1917
MRMIYMLLALFLLIGTASADGVCITFDEGRLVVGEEIGDTYADLGVTFSDGAKVVDTKCWGTDLGFHNPDNHVTTISFSPAVTSVSIEFEDAWKGNMDAILVNGDVLNDKKYNFWWFTEKKLVIESVDVPIVSVGLSSGSPCVNSIKYNNLCYNQIPEFPTIALPMIVIIGLAFVFRKRE